MLVFAWMVIVVLIVSIVHAMGLTALALFAAVRIEEVGIGIGPLLGAISVGNVKVGLHAFPLGSFLKTAAFDPRDPAAHITTFSRIHPLRRAGVMLGGCLAVYALALVCLGPERAWDSFREVYSAAVQGAVLSVGENVDVMTRVDGFIRGHTMLETMGVLTTVVLVFNLLPIPGLPGGNLLIEFVSLVRPITAGVREKLLVGGFVVNVFIVVGWAYGLVRYALRGTG